MPKAKSHILSTWKIAGCLETAVRQAEIFFSYGLVTEALKSIALDDAHPITVRRHAARIHSRKLGWLKHL